METIYITDSSQIKCPSVATVGFFDGVHRGHRYLINQLKSMANGLPVAVITFPEHPRKVLQQDYRPKLLNTFEERLQNLASVGIDYCYIMNFTKELAEISACDFIQQILFKRLNIQELLIGYDHKFGKGRIGYYELYADYGKACGMQILQASEYQSTDGRHISSTSIRHLLNEGNVQEAAADLSYIYTLDGIIVHGNRLGRTIGFPTANINLNNNDKIIPKEGVYAIHIYLKGETYPGMAYIGKRPTVTSHSEQRVEVNIFHFDKNIYGDSVRVEFTNFLRSDIRFNNLEELKIQLAIDRQAAGG